MSATCPACGDNPANRPIVEDQGERWRSCVECGAADRICDECGACGIPAHDEGCSRLANFPFEIKRLGHRWGVHSDVSDDDVVAAFLIGDRFAPCLWVDQAFPVVGDFLEPDALHLPGSHAMRVKGRVWHGASTVVLVCEAESTASTDASLPPQSESIRAPLDRRLTRHVDALASALVQQGLLLRSVGVHDDGALLDLVASRSSRDGVTVTGDQVAIRHRDVMIRNHDDAADELEHWRHWSELYDVEQALSAHPFPVSDNARRAGVNRYIDQLRDPPDEPEQTDISTATDRIAEHLDSIDEIARALHVRGTSASDAELLACASQLIDATEMVRWSISEPERRAWTEDGGS